MNFWAGFIDGLLLALAIGLVGLVGGCLIGIYILGRNEGGGGWDKPTGLTGIGPEPSQFQRPIDLPDFMMEPSKLRQQRRLRRHTSRTHR